MRILVMSIDSNFVFEFIAGVMVIMLEHVRSALMYAHGWRYLSYMSQRLSEACVRVSVVLHLKPVLPQVNWLLRFLTVQPWDPLSSLEPLPVLIKVPETGGFSRVLGVVGIISIFMY